VLCQASEGNAGIRNTTARTAKNPGREAGDFRTGASITLESSGPLAQEQHQQNDDRDRNADQPKQRAFS
jgi:hypothetical protein